MSPNQFRILRTLTAGPRTSRDFTHAESLDLCRIAPHIVQIDLDKLEAAGRIDRVQAHYYITTQGRADVDLGTPAPKLGIPTETFGGTRWQIREGGRDHEQHQSFGTLC